MAENDNEYQDLGTETRERRNNVLPILLALLLLASLGFNIFQYQRKAESEQELNQELVSSNDLQTQLRQQLESVRLELDNYKGKSAQLDSVIAKRERELEAKADEIEGLLSQNKVSYNKYMRIKGEIDKYKFLSEKYVKEVNELTVENKRLTADNSKLKGAVTEREKTIDQLTDQNVMLGNRMSLASQLVAEDITVTGVSIRSGGREKETTRAKQIEKLKVCFLIPKNFAATAGKRVIYLQILNPRGETIAVQAAGSGITTVDGTNAQYTTSGEIEYNTDPKNYCLYWGNTPDYQDGQYKVRIFTDGYQMGEKAFTIK